MQNIHSPLQAQLVQWLVAPGATVAAGDVLVILEAMKMEHEIRANQPGRVGELYFQAGEAVGEGEVLGVLNMVLVKSRRESVLSNPSGIAYAIPARHVRELMERHNLSASGAAHHLMRLGAGLAPLPPLQPQDTAAATSAPAGEEPRP